jgi:hypothetical protein
MSVITNNTIQPSSGQPLTIKDEGGTASITVATNGEATFAENIIVGTAGKGIDFSNASDVATGETVGTNGHILDDYEEGTFTPTPKRTTTNPGTSGSPDLHGKYTKIGNKVFIQGAIVHNGYNSPHGSGNWYIDLPFTNSGKTAGFNKGRVYMDGDSQLRQFRLHESTTRLYLHTPDNDAFFTSNVTYVIWQFSGSYLAT